MARERSGAGAPTRGGQTAAPSPASRAVGFGIAAILLALAVCAAYLGAAGYSFDMFSRSAAVGTATNKAFDAVRAAGRTPYSAEQFVFIPIAVLLAGGGLTLLLSAFPRVPGTLLRRFAAAVAGVATLSCAAVIVLEIAWAATGHPYSDYQLSRYGHTFAFPISLSAVLLALSAAASFVLLRRVLRPAAGSPRRPARYVSPRDT